ncbi:AAA family ATPase [Poseidonocella sedimentorum]|uniref:Predicted kinase n=1 Tax=Poseidonocella sedimentorum TaxID=871652 RepID=A0A1I6CYA8_9RHOB|nr:ATP-binding protein [Poseidonocella sedimentorum]SFQ98216.1 Predicted kinase [Poseidonocella sedimentorum]
MLSDSPTLHMLCGKIASGKSTMAAQLGAAPGTVLVAEDVWLEALFAEELHSLKDYLRCSSKLQTVMGPHVVALLNAGVSVVLDFPANTAAQRAWMREIIAGTGAAHVLHVFDVPDEVCLARLRARNAAGDHPFAVTEAQFHQFSSHFAPPTAEEGFDLVVHGKAHRRALET